MRCFIAVDVPQTMRAIIAKLYTPDSGAHISWVKLDHLHITLKFLGDITQDQLMNVQQVMQQITVEPGTITLEGIGCFPDRKNPKVIWIGITDADILIRLQQTIDEKLKHVFPEDKAFDPHLTIARVKKTQDPEKFKTFLRTLAFSPVNVPLTTCSLYESRFTSQGNTHHLIKTWTAHHLLHN